MVSNVTRVVSAETSTVVPLSAWMSQEAVSSVPTSTMVGW